MFAIDGVKYGFFLGLVSVIVTHVDAAARGLAWATDNRWAPQFSGSAISWYHHWQEPVVPQMPGGIEYVPMNWGPLYAKKWAYEVQQMNTTLPNYILYCNEPDVPSQANMTASDAVTDYMTNMQQWRAKGVKVSSPQIVWNITWMTQFMNGIKAQGGDVDYMAIHYYGAWNDLATPKAYIQKVYAKWGKNIWITELGTTSASGGTEQNQIDFMNSMLDWMDTQSYIERVVWSGAWAVTNPPDGFINAQDGIFYANSTLRSIGLSYAGGQIAAPSTTTIAAVTTTTKALTTTTIVSTTTAAPAPPKTTTTRVTIDQTTTVRTKTRTSTGTVIATRTTSIASKATSAAGKSSSKTCKYNHKRSINKGNIAIRRD